MVASTRNFKVEVWSIFQPRNTDTASGFFRWLLVALLLATLPISARADESDKKADNSNSAPGLTAVDPTTPLDPPSSFSTEHAFRPEAAYGYDPFDVPAVPVAATDPFETPLRTAYDPFDAKQPVAGAKERKEINFSTSPSPAGRGQGEGASKSGSYSSSVPQAPKKVTDAAFASPHVAALDRFASRQVVNLQIPNQAPINTEELPPQQTDASKNSPSDSRDPCAAMNQKPFNELGINIVLPNGLLPKDYAAQCAQQGYGGRDTANANRCWSQTSYHWDPTCLCYRPLYFEEINLERYGYGCCECVQPAVSAAHFFVTVPALPYCMAINCPCQCEYALGTYRPGTCGVPWRRNWPQCWPNCF